MNLKNALTAIARFADGKSDAKSKTGLVRLAPGSIRAMNGHSGCQIPVEGSLQKIAPTIVCYQDLRRIVSALDNYTLTVKRKTLHIEGGGSKFKLRCLPSTSVIAYPDEPTEDRWVSASGDVLSSLAALTEVIETTADATNGLASLRITPTWAATATQAMLVVLHTELGVGESVSVAPAAVAGLGTSEGGAVCVQNNKLWVRDDLTGQVRWAQALAAPWPDTIVEALLPTTITAPHRVTASTDLLALKGLADKARLLTTGDEYGRLSTDDRNLRIEGNFARGSFAGTAALKIDNPIAALGVSPMRLSTLLGVVGSSSVLAAHGAIVSLSFGGDNAAPQPIVFALGPIEALLMPVVLPR